jgi:hypothetical protein
VSIWQDLMRFDFGFYERTGYRVIVKITVEHPMKKNEPLRRYCMNFVGAKNGIYPAVINEFSSVCAAFGCIDVYKFYERATLSLPKRKALYTAKDVNTCFPWLKATTINNRIKSGYMNPTHSSSTTGIPNVFTLPELVHCAVLDDLSAMGALNDLKCETTLKYSSVVL